MEEICRMEEVVGAVIRFLDRKLKSSFRSNSKPSRVEEEPGTKKQLYADMAFAGVEETIE